MGALSARLPLPTAERAVVAPERLPAEDEPVDVVFSAVLIVPFLVLLIAVRDNGVGIPAEYHDAIFEMFRRVPDGNGGAAGSGMGLAIVKRSSRRTAGRCRWTRHRARGA
jgi:signal transduction histidine kinase